MTQNKWTDEELVGLKGVDPDSTTWKATAEAFPGRSPASCRQKWFSMRGDTNERNWSRDEDDRLCYAMSVTKKWPKVAKIVGTRNYRQCQNRWQRMGKKGLAIKCSVKPSGRPVLKKMASKTDANTLLDTTMEAMDLNWNNGAPAPVGSGNVARSFASMNEIAVRLPAESELAPVDMAPLATKVATPDESLSQAEVDYWSTVLVNAT